MALLLLSFLTIELVLYWLHWFPLTRVETDGLDYMERATGALFQVHAFHGPGYSLAIRLAHLAGIDLFSAAKLVSVLCGLGFVSLAWLTLSSFVPANESLVATALLIFSPTVLCASGSILSDMMGGFLFLSVLALLLVRRRPGAKIFLLAGATAGLAYLTRYIYFVLLVVPPLSLVCWRERLPKAAALTSLLCFYAGFMLIVSPWLALLYQVKGNPFWSENHLNAAFKLYREVHDWTGFPTRDEYSGWLDVYTAAPTSFLRVWMATLGSLPGQLLGTIPGVGRAFGFLGFLVWIARGDARRAALLLVGAAYALPLCLVWIEERFLLPLVPLASSFVASGLLVTPRRLTLSVARWSVALPLRSLVVVMGLLLVCASSLKEVAEYFSDQAPEYKAAAEWLAEVKPQAVSVMAAKPHVTFFSGTRRIGFASRGLGRARIEDLPAILARIRPTYLVYDARYAAAKFPQFAVLLDPRSNPYSELLRPVFEVNVPMRLMIYEYLG